jgi:urocanate hydratase
MALDPNPTAAFDLALQLALLVERHFAALVRAADSNREPSLGGKLLYAGELDAEGRALIVAANIAGAASLAATSDPPTQKQAIRDGVADFLVTSLDEALRILKNQIRKRETVAVCVADAPEAVEREMLERGVLPDLLRPSPDTATEYAEFQNQGAQPIQLSDLDENQTLLAWSVSSAPTQWLPKLDAIALACIESEDAAARRWLRLAPRYLGRLAQNQRLLRCNKESAQKFLDRLRDQVEQGEIKVPVEIRLTDRAQTEQQKITPPPS